MKKIKIILWLSYSLGFVSTTYAQDNALVQKGQTITMTSSDTTETIHLLEDKRLPADGILEFDMTPLNDKGHIGAIIRYESPESWVYLGCDMSADLFGRAVWFISTPKGTTTVFTKDINKPFANVTRRIRLKYLKDLVTLWVEGEEVAHSTLPESVPYTGKPGKIGFRAWNGGAMKIGNVHYSPCSPLKAAKTPAKKSIKIASDAMEVVLDRSFPRVLEYTWQENAAKLYGQLRAYNYITINGHDYQPAVKTLSISDNTVAYELKVAEAQITIHLSYTVEGNSLTMQMTSIEEKGDVKVKTIGFPQNSMVSVKHSQAGGALSLSRYVPHFTNRNVFGSNVSYQDFFYKLQDKKADPLYHTVGIAILNTDALAATMDNNVLQNLRQLRYQTREQNGEISTGIGNSDWVYRGLDDEITELPRAKVFITPDANNDHEVDWQDGAIALRKTILEFDGAKKLHNSFFHLGKTEGSQTNYTFLRWLDLLKKVWLYTDGFGQVFQIKGYQSEGHDSAHPDYGNNFNKRAGGFKDLQTLFRSARLHHVDICLHINHSESYPEAKSFDPEIVSGIPGWRWWDQSYFIKRKPDILNGTFKRRLYQLHDTLPELNTVYIDTYREERWIAWYTAKLFQQMGWAVYTEDSDTFDRFASWVHYAPGGTSKISRFVHHQNRDGYKTDPLLFGGYESRNKTLGNLTDMMHSFMTHQLPYRYLMNFPVMKWTDKEALLGKGVRSAVDKGQTVITKNNKTILKGSDVFIPWDPVAETKIYHYNTTGSTGTWTLPNSWMGQATVELYELTDLGRKFVKTVPVQAGKVTLEVKNKTPYVLYKRKAASVRPVEWGEGSLVKDMGFDSKSFTIWKKDPASADQKSISIQTSAQGNAFLAMQGQRNTETSVSQKITGLEGGKTYAASVWAEVTDGSKAMMSIADYGGPEVSNYFAIAGLRNTIASQKKGNYQRMRVLFTMPQGSTQATLSLKASPGATGSFVHFDDVRIVPFSGELPTEHLFYEDFENVDEGFYPFIQQTTSSRVHLSEKHEGYTKDVLSGNFSFKISSTNPNGPVAQTLPCNLRFRPNTKYTLRFKFRVDRPERYRIIIKSIRKAQSEPALLDEYLNESGHFEQSFTTANVDDYAIFIYKYGQNGDADLIMDDLTVD